MKDDEGEVNVNADVEADANTYTIETLKSVGVFTVPECKMTQFMLMAMMLTRMMLTK